MQNGMSAGAIAIAATTLATSLPDIRGRRQAREQVRELAENGGFIAGMIGVALHATALMMQVR